jgi:N-acetylneuraminic acid mutarotase
MSRFRRVIALLLTATALSAAPAWERLAALPIGNGGFITASIAGDVVIAGGTTWQGDVKAWLNQIWVYEPARNTWRAAGRLEVPLAYAVTGHGPDISWFAGGSSGQETHRALWKIEKGLVPQRIATLEPGIVYAAGGRIGPKLYVVGGSDDQGALERVGSRFFAFDLKTGAATRLADYPEAGLMTGTAAAVGDNLYVFGGARWDAEKKAAVNYASAHTYSIVTSQWTALPPLPHPGRGYTAVALDDRHIFIAGGYRNDVVEFVADAYLFDVKSGKYTPSTPLPYAAMVGLVQNGDWLYCLGGEDRKKHRTDAAFRIRWRELLR